MKELEPREEPTKKELEEIEKMLEKGELYDEEFDDFDSWNDPILDKDFRDDFDY